jgi:TolB-like protein/DNA-binding winged helix-turn-helix (wHTH) protein/Flp pilus assembly protein TadD
MMKKKGYFEFGEFRLDVKERALLRNGEILQLTPKAFDTLLILVENAGTLVEKDAMMQAIWPDSFVEEIGLVRNISVLRKALGQDAEGQPFIETVPKRGYRFNARVRERLDEGAELVYEQSSVSQTVEIYREYATGEGAANRVGRAQELLATEPQVNPVRIRAEVLPLWKTRRAVAVYALLGLILGAAIWYALSVRRSQPFDKSKIQSIAVLPFKRLDAADDSERLGIGLADTLITRLSNIRALSVRPTRDVMRFEEAQQDIAETGRTLEVDAVLDGSVQRVGDRVRVTVRLIHTASKAQLWAAQLDEKLTDIFVLQDAIATRVAESLSLSLSDVEQQRIKKTYTQDVEAYQAYLKGRYFWNKRTRGDLEKTIEHFEEAIHISPGYALAYSGLADAYATRANRSRNAARRALSYKLAREAAIRAIELDEHLAEAHTSLGSVLRSLDWDWEGSEKALQRAIELNPNYPTAHHYYALLLATVGRLEEALSEITTAQRLDPLSLVINADLAMIYIFTRRPAQAIEVVKKALEINRQFPRLQQMLLWAYQEAGMLDAAIRESQSLPEIEGEEPILAMSILGYGYAVAGQRDKARLMVDKLLTLTEQISPALVQAAAVCSGLKDKDRAFELLEKALALKDDRLLWIKVDPRFDALRADKRYPELLRRLNLPQ